MKQRSGCHSRLLLAILILPIWAISAQTSATDLRFSGFASAAGGTTLDKGTEYIVEPTTNGTYDDKMRFDPESIMGLQVQAIVNDRLRATLQIVSKGGDDFNTSADWAFISYDIQPNFTLNAGRYRLPTFYYSESLDVGYSYYWIRPPVEVYRIFTSTLEGVNLYYSTFIEDVEITTQAWYGAIDTDLYVDNVDIHIDTLNNQGVNTNLGWKWFNLRLVYNSVDLDTTVTPPAPAVPLELSSNVEFTAIAFMADFEQFKWRSEYTHADDKNNDVTKAWYLSAAYAVGKFTPHFTHAELDAREEPIDFDRATDTLGLAWNFDQSVVFKVEYTESETQTALQSTTTKLVAVALDIVF